MEINTVNSVRVTESHEVLARALSVASAAAVVMMDPEGLISFWNQGAEDIFGWTSEEIVGRNLHQILVPEQLREAHQKAFPHFIATGEGAATGKTVRLAGLHRDGSEVRVQLSITAMPMENGWGAMAILQDITEHLELENDLIQERLQLFALFDSLVDSVYVIDPVSNELLYMNDAAVGIWGNGMGQKCYRVIHNRDKPCSFCNHDQLFGDNMGTSTICERKNLANGHWFRSVDRGIHLSDGRAVRLEIAVDVTEKKNQELAMVKALEEAEQASLTKSQFMANVSHELRTPLNGMIGMLGLLLDTDLTEEQKDYVETAVRSSDSLLTVVGDVLDFSMIETGEMALDPQPFSPETVFHEALEPLAAQAEEKGLAFSRTVDSDVPAAVRGHPPRLIKVLRSIVGNAVKFTAEGAVDIRLGLDRASGGKALLRFTVTDSGIGIDQDKLKEIFNPFSQADASLTRSFEGLGLGLTIAKRMVESLGGRIGGESDGSGKGSTFWFTVQCDIES